MPDIGSHFTTKHSIQPAGVEQNQCQENQSANKKESLRCLGRHGLYKKCPDTIIDHELIAMQRYELTKAQGDDEWCVL